MISSQQLIVYVLLISLSLLHIDAHKHRHVRQAASNQCAFPNAVMCDFVQCVNGRCIDDKNSVDCYKCLCSPGYTGQLCDTSIITPSSCNPGCLNGGQCSQMTVNGSVCTCTPQFTGKQCETPIIETHPCVKNPETTCKNGGTCTTYEADYTCICAVGWSGKNCEVQESVISCNTNPCGLHGTCIQNILSTGAVSVCKCENGWTGEYCDTNMNGTCSTQYCLFGGTCQVNSGTTFCTCPSTHTGPRCEIPIESTNTTTTLSTMTTTSATTPLTSSCSTSPCLNGGQCFNTGNSFICLCKPEWSGLTCDKPNVISSTALTTTLNPNICNPNPCSNGGKCYRHSNSFVCVCTSQYTGPTCNVLQTTTASTSNFSSSTIPCNSQPCRNGGTCYNSGTSYFCYCGSNGGFTGKDCETAITTPSTNCPFNCGTGTCVAVGSQSQYACMCNGTLSSTTC